MPLEKYKSKEGEAVVGLLEERSAEAQGKTNVDLSGPVKLLGVKEQVEMACKPSQDATLTEVTPRTFILLNY